MIVTISRPGALPHQQVRTKVRYKPGQIAVIAEGSSFELLRGNLPGTATLKFSAPPDVQPGDWVRVYLDGDPCLPGQPEDRPHYLGEALNEVWEAGVGDLALRGLTERIRKAAWRGPLVEGKVSLLTGLLRPYLLDVLTRSELGPVTVGSVPESPVGFRSVAPFETLGTTLDTVMPALPGGVAGVDARATFHVQEAFDAVTMRFPRSRSDRPPGRVDSYANAVRFKYNRPSGAEAAFELKLSLEVTHYKQAAWAEESLPASVTTVAVNPYAALPVQVFSSLTYPGANAGMTVSRDTSLSAMSPTWTGHLGDGVTWDTGVLSGGALQLRATGQDGYTFGTVVQTGMIFGPLLPELRLRVELPDNATQTLGAAGDGHAGQPGDPTWTYEPNTFPAGGSVRYHPDDLLAYLAAHGTYPHGFDLRLVGTSSPTSLRIIRGAAPVMDPTRVVMVENDYSVPASGAAQLVPAPAMLLPMRASLHLPSVAQWRGGDQVTTDVHVTAVKIYDSETQQQFVLTRADDDADTGRRIWTLPDDARADGVMVEGDLRQIGWVGLRIADEAGLAIYAYGLLRNRVQPARSWKGTVRSLWADSQKTRLDVRGRARFDTPAGDRELDIQKATYNLGDKSVIVECGTPWPADDAEALAGAIERVERSLVKAGGG